MSYQLSSTQWRQVESFLPGRPGWVGVTAKDNRTFVNGVLWVLRSGAQWKDLLSRVNYICRLASISFAGSPPWPGPVAGQRWSGSWGRQTPG